jgi:hypothetical protein
MSRQTNHKYTLRLMAAAILLAIGLVGLVHLPRAWAPTGYPTQKALGVVEVYSPGTPTITQESTFAQLLEVARATCPEDRPFIVLGDEVPLFLLTDYYMYPRKIVRVRSDQRFEPALLQQGGGGCLGAYRENVGRVKPVMEQVEEIACSKDGCVYHVK